MQKIKVSDVTKRSSTKAEIDRAKKKGFIWGKMDASVSADQVGKMKYQEGIERKRKRKAERNKVNKVK